MRWWFGLFVFLLFSVPLLSQPPTFQKKNDRVFLIYRWNSYFKLGERRYESALQFPELALVEELSKQANTAVIDPIEWLSVEHLKETLRAVNLTELDHLLTAVNYFEWKKDLGNYYQAFGDFSIDGKRLHIEPDKLESFLLNNYYQGDKEKFRREKAAAFQRLVKYSGRLTKEKILAYTDDHRDVIGVYGIVPVHLLDFLRESARLEESAENYRRYLFFEERQKITIHLWAEKDEVVFTNAWKAFDPTMSDKEISLAIARAKINFRARPKITERAVVEPQVNQGVGPLLRAPLLFVSAESHAKEAIKIRFFVFEQTGESVMALQCYATSDRMVRDIAWDFAQHADKDKLTKDFECARKIIHPSTLTASFKEEENGLFREELAYAGGSLASFFAAGVVALGTRRISKSTCKHKIALIAGGVVLTAGLGGTGVYTGMEFPNVDRERKKWAEYYPQVLPSNEPKKGWDHILGNVYHLPVTETVMKTYEKKLNAIKH